MFNAQQLVNYAVGLLRILGTCYLNARKVKTVGWQQGYKVQTVIAAWLQEYDNPRDVIFDICSKESKEIAGRIAMMI
jgi:hypothetical protein